MTSSSEPMDLAWRLLKMPVVDTAAGVPVAYGDDVWWDENVDRSQIMGAVPFTYKPKDGPVDMTPNQYFDRLNVGVPESIYRWTGRFPTEERNEKIASMVEALRAGQTMGAPQLWFSESSEEEPWEQEGGHRMEALRHMGHGDTPIPVWHRYTR